MKIQCTKEEFAKLIRECCRNRQYGACTNCVLLGVPRGGEEECPENFVEIVEEKK